MLILRMMSALRRLTVRVLMPSSMPMATADFPRRERDSTSRSSSVRP